LSMFFRRRRVSHLVMERVSGFFSESQGKNLALTVLFVRPKVVLGLLTNGNDVERVAPAFPC